MALTNHERVGKAMDLLRRGLGPFIEREIRSIHRGMPAQEAFRYTQDTRLAHKPITQWDAYALLKLMWNSWNSVFRNTLGHAERTYVSELRDARNKWAHQQSFSTDDAHRTLDTAARLLNAISAPEAREVGRMKTELLRRSFAEQVRTKLRSKAQTTLATQVSTTLPPWREVVTPHPDVASGGFQQAEFAADLWQVHQGEGSDEYRDPAEFFRRTYLTESLRGMLIGAVRRLSGGSGDPVIQLQTNFGGGKTHSMLALYHMFSGTAPADLVGVDALMADAKVDRLPAVQRVVLVGNQIRPATPATKHDGTEVRTLWGELAWQLGGREAFADVALDDEKGTSPGAALRKLFRDYGPCLILIDEWVAYARQLHDDSDLPAGSFDTQFTFAQALTEAAKAVDNCLLVISLPASDTKGSPHSQADAAEVGGRRGREALHRLSNVVGRVESAWRPATAEEGFAIVKRRLFQPMDAEAYKKRDVVSRSFVDYYRRHHQEFPPECRDADYEKRLAEAYPIHPEVFDRLYEDWSTLLRFQRTRGVLRLMASVIHSLWEKGDKNPLILPSMIPIDDDRVRSELTNYLPDRWVPIIEKDVDGPASLPLRLDGQISNLGKVNACRRVARTIYMGSAPLKDAARRGLDDRRVKLGCVLPGESPAVFGDALRRLAGSATYLYQEGARAWYDTQPTVNKMAADRAEQLIRDPNKVTAEIERRVRNDAARRGNFHAVHHLPRTPSDVPDDPDVRLVVLGPDAVHVKGADSAALAAARTLLESRGAGPRLRRNALVFLASDKTRLQELDEAVRRYLAWCSIIDERETLSLEPGRVRQAETRRDAEDKAVKARLPEAFRWLIVPGQTSPQSAIEWQALPLMGTGSLAERASKKLRRDELLVTSYGGTRVRMDLDRVPLWRGDHVSIRQLAEDYSQYPYLTRLKDPSVLVEAVANGISLLTWESEAFAYAESHDEEAGRYRGLRGGSSVSLSGSDVPGLVVRPEVARQQLDAEIPDPPPGPVGPTPPPSVGPGGVKPGGEGPSAGPTEVRPTRFHGSVVINTLRASSEVGTIAEEVLAHLEGLVGSNVKLTLEIEAQMPDGAPEHVVRTVTENARTLKFESQGFEEE